MLTLEFILIEDINDSLDQARKLAAIAREVGCTPAQLALAWLLHKDATLIPIPGTSQIAHLEENLAADQVMLSAEQMQRLEDLINPRTVRGARYNAQNASEVDTEEFAV